MLHAGDSPCSRDGCSAPRSDAAGSLPPNAPCDGFIMEYRSHFDARASLNRGAWMRSVFNDDSKIGPVI